MIYSWKFYVIKYIYCGFIDVLLEGVANISAVAVLVIEFKGSWSSAFHYV